MADEIYATDSRPLSPKEQWLVDWAMASTLKNPRGVCKITGILDPGSDAAAAHNQTLIIPTSTE